MDKEPKQYGLEQSPRDYPEDFKHENGMYMCNCHSCSKTFIGYKRRNICKVCLENGEEVKKG